MDAMTIEYRFRVSLVAAFAGVVLAAGAHAAEPAPPSEPADVFPADVAAPVYVAADPSAPEVTAKTVFAQERFWPYHVDLSRSWKGEGFASEVPVGTRGVLVRMEDAERARIDFGRHGVGTVPIDRTDLVARANSVRLGTGAKPLPNFVEALGPRLLASSLESPRPYPVAAVFMHAAFVCVFADVAAPSFEEIARALVPLRRSDVLTIVLPQGRPSDVAVFERLRALAWRVPFVFQHLAEPYTASLAGPSPTLPLVTLQTPNGRLLFSERWGDSVAAALGKRIEAELGPPPVPSAKTP
jgi:hypothetical protein